MEELERLAELDLEADGLEPGTQVAYSESGLVGRHASCLPDELDRAFCPDLRVEEIRLAEGESPSGSQMREGVREAGVEIDVVQDADPDDRVELASFELLACFHVPNDDLGPVADAFPCNRGRRVAQLDRDEIASALEQALGELTGAAAQLEAADAGPEVRVVDQEPRAPICAARARSARPAPDTLLAGGDQLALPALVVVSLAYFGSSPCDSAYLIAASVIGSRRYG